MVRFRSPFIRVLFAFILGLGSAHYSHLESMQGALIAFLSLLTLYAALVAWQAWSTPPKWLTLLTAFVGLAACTAAGMVRLVQSQSLLHDKHHLLKQKKIKAYQGVVLMHKRYATYTAITLSIKSVQGADRWQEAKGKVRVWIPNYLAKRYSYGDLLRIQGTLQKIPPPRNPYAFDYQRMSMQKGIYHQGFVYRSADITPCGYAPPSRCMALAYGVRSYLRDRLSAVLPDPKARSTTLALVLGIREEVDDLMATFSAAGIMHILAVSGLHAGMLYMILLALLSLFGVVGFRRRTLQGVVLLGGLWAYAFVTALSASVLRAVTMLSLATMAKLMGRRYDFWNSFAFTAFIALWYEPMWWYDLGCRLSYLSVIGIKLGYRPFRRLFTFSHPLLRRLGEMASISLSVQLATLPLTLYHFHTFPLYFLFGNFLAVPAASLILGLGLLSCLMAPLPWIGPALGALLSSVCQALYLYAASLQHLPYNTLGPFWPTLYEVGLAYAGLLGMWAFLTMRKFPYLLWAASSLFGLSFFALERSNRQQQQKVVTLYALAREPTLSLVMGRRAILFSNLSRDAKVYQREVQPSLDAMGVHKAVILPWKASKHGIGGCIQCESWYGVHLILWGGQKIVCLDKEARLPPALVGEQAIDLLFVDGYGVGTFAPWLALLQPRIVLLGMDLGPKKRRQLQEEIRRWRIPYHDLRQEGAWTHTLSP